MKTRAVILLVAVILAACGKPPPEAELAAAGEALGEATTTLSDLDAQIAATEQRLDRLRAERRSQRDRVRTLEERLEARATDVAVFRAVQSALLDDERLEAVAIAVDVEDRNLTLTGEVRSREEAAHAVELSEQVTGVASVRSRLRVNDPRSGAGAR